MIQRKIEFTLIVLCLLSLVGCNPAKMSTTSSSLDSTEESVDHSCSYFYFLWGNNAEYGERYAEALEAYEKASICDPRAEYIAEKIPLLLIQLGRFEEATQWLEEYIKDRPDKSTQRYMLARLKLRAGEEDDAIRLYHETLDHDPENDNIRLRLGLLYSQKGEFETAEALFKTILEKDEKTYFAILYLARLYSRTGDLDLSETRYFEALEINWSKDLSYEIAEFYNLRKQFIKAQEMYRDILSRDATDERASLGVVQTYLFLQQGEEALKELKRIREFTNNPDRTDLVRAQILINIGEIKRAKDILLALLENNALAQANYLLGVILYEEMAFDDALQVLKRISSDASEYRESILLQVRILEETNRSTQSIHLLEESIQQENTRLPVFYSLLGSIFIRVQQGEKALQTLAEGVVLFPENVSLLYDHAITVEKQGRHEQAMESMKKILTLDPNHADALNFIGYSWADRNINLDKALEYISKALELKPESGYIKDSLGWVYFKMGEYEKAKQELEQAVILEPDDPYIYEHLGDTYLALELPQEALNFYQRAKTLHTDEDKINSLRIKINAILDK